jgi:putative transposase
MPLTRHLNHEARYFFTVVTEDRRPLLIDHIGLLRRAFRITRDRHPFEIDAIVVLPDHLHTVWRLPASDNDPSKRWRVLKRLFSCGIPDIGRSPAQLRRRENGVWQRRFWEHCIKDQQDWLRHIEYIYYNPVKHGYCELPSQWPYSSFAKAVRRGSYGAEWKVDPGEIGRPRIPMESYRRG